MEPERLSKSEYCSARRFEPPGMNRQHYLTDLSETLALLRIAARAGLAPDADVRLLASRATFWVVEPDSAINLYGKLIAALDRCALAIDAETRAEEMADFAAILQEIEMACRQRADY